jgi:hypothetical protein
MAYMGDVCTGRKYQDNQGQEKTKYTKIGAWFENDQGQLSVKLDALPMPDEKGECWLKLFVPQPQDGQQAPPQQQRAQQPQQQQRRGRY